MKLSGRNISQKNIEKIQTNFYGFYLLNEITIAKFEFPD